MLDSILERVPVVGSLGYRERIQRLPGSFTATLVTEPANRYFRHAVAVLAGGEKVGYVAPELAARWFDAASTAATPLTCPGRRGRHSDHETSGVELLLDFRGLPAISNG